MLKGTRLQSLLAAPVVIIAAGIAFGPGCGPAGNAGQAPSIATSTSTASSSALILWGQEPLVADVAGCDDASAELGHAVVVTGTTLVASAPSACRPFAGATAVEGAIVVFDREAGQWLEGDVIRRGTPADGDRLGASLAFAEPHLVAGVPGSAVVEVFARVGRRFLSQATLERPLGAPPPARGSGFGEAVAVGGDTIVVGAGNASAGAIAGAGVAFVYVRTGTNWQPSQIVAPPNPTANGHFGRRVATNGSNAVVGGENEVSVYRRGAASFVLQETFPAPGLVDVAMSGTRFAAALADGRVLIHARQLDGEWRLEDDLQVANASASAVGFSGAQLVVADADRVASFLATGALGLTDDPAWVADGDVDGWRRRRRRCRRRWRLRGGGRRRVPHQFPAGRHQRRSVFGGHRVPERLLHRRCVLQLPLRRWH